jgi:tetratricopeptide (TPR) repeat protein
LLTKQAQQGLECYKQCVVIARELKNQFGEAAMLINKGYVLDQLGDRGDAILSYEQALEIFERLNAPEALEVRATLAEWKGGVSELPAQQL